MMEKQYFKRKEPTDEGVLLETEFEEAFGESFDETLDMGRWLSEADWGKAYQRLDEEVAAAVQDEDRYRQHIRQTVFTSAFFADLRQKHRLGIIGKYQAKANDLQQVQKVLLFSGGVEACDGINVVHDTLPLTITQIGVCLVSYQGTDRNFSHRLYRRDLRSRPGHATLDEVETLLQRRGKREAQNLDGNVLSELARRGVMTFAERTLLAKKATAPWRMGHGSPAPYELLTNFWTAPPRLRISLELIRWFVEEHQRFVFVPSAPRDRHLITLGNALDPLEYLIIGTLQPDMQTLIDNGSYRRRSGTLQAMQRFAEEIASQVVVGLYRVWQGAPAYLFYAHVHHLETAAHIVMADSLLQEHRGFPLLIDLADSLCKSAFGSSSFLNTVQTAYADAGQPYRYMGERETRTR